VGWGVQEIGSQRRNNKSNGGGARVGGKGVEWWRCAVSVGLAVSGEHVASVVA
jgi:hypothetical protein